jgi:cytosine/adenosine deaminase-related metal-dependent hydrolase
MLNPRSRRPAEGLLGVFVMPAFVDNHTHFLRSAVISTRTLGPQRAAGTIVAQQPETGNEAIDHIRRR